jgi:glycosyltransferase involved in cell wall biosynthesis
MVATNTNLQISTGSKILYFTRGYSPHDHRFVSSLVNAGMKVYYLQLEKKTSESRPFPSEVELVTWKNDLPLNWKYLPGYMVRLRQIVKRIKPDIIHAGPVPSCAYLAAFAGLSPLVSMSWGSDLLSEVDESKKSNRRVKFALRHSAILVGDCNPVGSKAKSMGFPEKKIVLFPWGIDLDHFKRGADTSLRTRLGWQDEFVILSLRAWEPLYGVDTLVEAFCQAASHNPKLRLILLGNGSLAGKIHQMVNRYGMVSMVHFGGQVSNPDLVRYYRNADLYVSASYSDGSSVSLMEALACGKPVLVSDIPGNHDWVVEGREGWFFKPGDRGGLTRVLLTAATSNRLGEMGQKAVEVAKEKADWRLNFPKLLQAYQMALQPGKVSHGF